MVSQDLIMSEYTELIQGYFQAIDILVKKGIKIDENLCFDIGKVNDIEAENCSDFDMAGYITLTKFKIFYLNNILRISNKEQREIVTGLGFSQEYFFKPGYRLIPYIDMNDFNEFRVLP